MISKSRSPSHSSTCLTRPSVMRDEVIADLHTRSQSLALSGRIRVRTCTGVRASTTRSEQRPESWTPPGSPNGAIIDGRLMAGLDGGLNGRAVAAILKTGTLADLRGRPERRRKRQGPGAYRSADLPARVERCVDLEGLELLQVARCQASAQLPSQHR